MANTVGAVYVKVFSDSSGFKKQLEQDSEKAGQKAAVNFGKKFDKQITKDLKKINLERTLGPQVDKWGKDFAQRVGSALSGEKVKFKLGDVLDRDELKRMSKELGIPFKQLAAYLKTEIPKSARKGFGAIEKEAADAASAAEKQLRKRLNLIDLIDDAGFQTKLQKLADDFEKTMTPAMRKALTDGQKVDWKFDDEIRKALKQISKDSNATFSDVERLWNRTIRRMAADSRKGGLFASIRVGAEDARDGILDLDTHFGKLRSGLRRAGTGGFFDSLTNVLGGVIGLALRIGSIVPKTISLVGKAFTGLGKVFTFFSSKAGKAAGVLGRMGGALAKVGGALSSTGVGAIAAVVGLGVALFSLVRFAGAAVTMLVDLAGMFAMLAAGIGAAVVSSAVLVPIAVSLAAGLGVLAIGAMEAGTAIGLYAKAMKETDPKKRAAALREYNKELEKLGPNTRSAVVATEDLIDKFGGLKRAVSEALFAGGKSGLDDAITASLPLVDALKAGLVGVADAVGDVIDKFLRLGENKQFMADFNTLWASAEVIVRNLGTAIFNTFTALTGFFAVISPYAETFSQKILDISENLKKWMESDENRAQLKQWFSDVWVLAGQLWGVIVALGGVLATFFSAIMTGPEGGEAGGFLGTIKTKLEELQAKIQELKDNGTLQRWFNEARETGKILWAFLVLLGKTLRDLNTPENREFAKSLISAMISVISGIKTLIGWLGNLKRAAQTAWSWVQKVNSLGGLLDFLPGGKKAAGGLVTSATNVIVGEAGPEAIIPLTRPLSMVDPSVREMAAMLRGQGKAPAPQGAPGGRQMTNYWTINTPVPDGRVTASQVINRMATMAG